MTLLSVTEFSLTIIESLCSQNAPIICCYMSFVDMSRKYLNRDTVFVICPIVPITGAI